MSGDFIRWKDEVPWHVRLLTHLQVVAAAVPVTGKPPQIPEHDPSRTSCPPETPADLSARRLCGGESLCVPHLDPVVGPNVNHQPAAVS